jgi:hypothetical protein
VLALVFLIRAGPFPFAFFAAGFLDFLVIVFLCFEAVLRLGAVLEFLAGVLARAGAFAEALAVAETFSAALTGVFALAGDLARLGEDAADFTAFWAEPALETEEARDARV